MAGSYGPERGLPTPSPLNAELLTERINSFFLKILLQRIDRGHKK